MSTQRADQILLGAGVLAIVVGAAAATVLLHCSSSDPAIATADANSGSASGEGGSQQGAGWRERSASRRRHEVLLRSLVANQAWEKALEEATSLLELDPFHDEARGLRDRAREALRMVQPGAEVGEEGRRTNSYEKARLEARKLIDSSIEGRYPDPAVATAVHLYALDGRLDQAIEKLRKLRDERAAKSRTTTRRRTAEEGAGRGSDARDVDDLIGTLVQIDAALQEGQGLLRKGRLADADEQLHVAITWDRQILPSDLGSVLVRDARRSVARAWLEDGKRHAARSQLSLAQASWRKGILADPTLLELQMAARRVDQKSSR